MDLEEYRRSNRRLWDDWTGIHEKSKMYNLEGFKSSPMSLHSLEREQVGDVTGKSLLHLQCHFGKDTLSWAGLGAQVTGADWSEKAVTLARSLSAELGIPARFILSDLYDLPSVLDEKFDVVFTSYGVLGWLHDLARWGEVVGHFVKPGGIFYIAEFHPFMWTLDETDPKELRVAYPYFVPPDKPLKFDVHGSYADPQADYHNVEYGWNHTMGDVLGALISNGLRVEYLREYPFSVMQNFPGMERGEDGMWHFREEDPRHMLAPMMFSIRAVKE